MELTKKQYIEVLQLPGILREGNAEMLSVLFYAPRCKATASQLSTALGHGSVSAPANSKLGNLGKRIARHFNISPEQRSAKSPGWWQYIATGNADAEGFVWELHTSLAEALIDLGLIPDADGVFSDDISEIRDLTEGAVRTIRINAYERNPVARKICIAHYGATCAVCDFDFEKKYGDLGKGYIHVHHLVEISAIGTEYRVDPVEDLRPVCPNCHSMLHRKRPAHSIEHLRSLVQDYT